MMNLLKTGYTYRVIQIVGIEVLRSPPNIVLSSLGNSEWLILCGGSFAGTGGAGTRKEERMPSLEEIGQVMNLK